uniref:Pentatricopeptide repeat-containing protein At1g62680, mitochondrial-like n=1 Tax=Nicotiana tabacum TaxID=4097 RepID=A0A1S4B2U3_TOBAC|nr:PREDICTED: pentatricopeptide repeat-containing protein At1g62680, mitochondrial-like [Nicotiana tabacum]
MDGKDVEPDVVTYSVIIDGYCLRGQMDRARSLFDSMIDKSIKPNIFSYSILINGYCKKKKLDESMHLFYEISRNGLNPRNVKYSTILKGLFDAGRTDFAEKFFAEMLSTGLKPDLCTNCILLGGYFHNGLVKKAMLLFYELEIKREDTYIQLYNVVQGFLKFSKISEMITFLKEMTGNDFSFDASTVELLIDVIAKDPSLLNMIPQFPLGNKK